MPDNQHFVSGGIDNFVTMWDIEGNKSYEIKTTRVSE